MADFQLEPLSPIGAIVRDFHLDPQRPPSGGTMPRLERAAADRGVLVFPNATLPAAALARVSTYFGSGVVVARHTVHAEALHEDVLRLSNDDAHETRIRLR